MRTPIRYLSPVFVVIAVLLALFGISKAMDLSLYTIQTGSMTPEFPIGTRVVVMGNTPVKPHEAITFTVGDSTITHVFLGTRANGTLITRGLANPSNDMFDTPVYHRDIQGKVVFKILVLAPAFWTSQSGVLFIGGILLIAFSVYLWHVLISREARTESTPEKVIPAAT